MTDDLLLLKYPGKKAEILANRKNGYLDEEIDREYQHRWEVNRFNGYSQGEIEKHYGLTEKSKADYLVALESHRNRVLGEAFQLSPSEVERTTQFASGLGVNPFAYLGNRKLYQKAKESYAQEVDRFTTPVEPPKNLKDLAGIYQPSKAPRFGATFSTLDSLLYPTARFAGGLERALFGIAGVIPAIADFALDKAEDAGIVEKGSALRKNLDYYVTSTRKPEDYGIISPWVAEKAGMRRQGAYTKGFFNGIVADVSDAVIDFTALITQMGWIGKASAVASNPGEIAGMLQQNLTALGQIAKSAKLHGTYGFLSTPGDLNERLQAGAYRVAYNLTPYVANATGAVGFKAVITDFLLNGMLTSPQYINAFKNNGFSKEALAQVIPQLVMDFGMAWHTRGDAEHVRKAALEEHIRNTAENWDIPIEQARELVDYHVKLADQKMGREWLSGGDSVPQKGETWYDPLTAKPYTVLEGDGNGVKVVDADGVERTMDRGYLSPEPRMNATDPANELPPHRKWDTKYTVSEDGTVKVEGGEIKESKAPLDSEGLRGILQKALDNPNLSDVERKIIRKELASNEPRITPELSKLITLDATKPEVARSILQEVYRDPRLTDGERERIRKELQADDPYIDPDMMEHLPIADAVGRMGAGSLRINRLKTDDMRVGALIRGGSSSPYYEQVKGLIKAISKTTGKEVAWEFLEKNLKLLGQYDLRHRAERTMENRNWVEEAVAGDPELADFLNKTDLAYLGKTTLNDMTLKELTALKEELELNAQKGAEIFAQKQMESEQALKQRGGLFKSILERNGKAQRPDVVKNREDIQGKKTGVKDWVASNTWTVNRVLAMLAGSKGFKAPGELVKFFWGKTNKCQDAVALHTKERRTSVMNDMKAKGISPKDLAEKVTVDGREYLVGELMGVYAHSLVAHQRRGLIDLNGFENEHIDNAVAALKGLDKDYAGVVHTIIKDFADNFDRINKAFIDYGNVGMEKIENYTPINFLYRENSGMGFIDNATDTMLAQLKLMHTLQRNYAKHGFTNERVADYPDDMRGAYNLNLFDVWNKAMHVQESFAAYGQHVREMQRTLAWRDGNGDSLQTVIRNTWGKTYEKTIQDYVNRVADPAFYKAYTAVDNLFSTVKHNATVAYLAYNVVTMLKQAPSIALYLADAGPVHLLSAIGEASGGGFKAMMERAEKWDPQIADRGIDQAYQEVRMRLDENYGWKAKLGQKGMQGIQTIDKITVTIGWNAVFNAYKAKGWSDAESARMAQTVTLNTQPASHAKDLSAMYATGSPAVNTLLMFTNQLNKIWGITTHDLYGDIKRGEVGHALLSSVGIGMSAMMIYALSGHIPGTDDDESFPEWMASAIGGQLGSSLPMIGKDIVSAMSGYEGGDIPIFKISSSLVKGGKAVVGATFGDEDFTFKEAKKVWEGLALLYGLPYAGPKRLAEAIVTGDPSALVGWNGDKKKGKKKAQIVNY